MEQAEAEFTSHPDFAEGAVNLETNAATHTMKVSSPAGCIHPFRRVIDPRSRAICQCVWCVWVYGSQVACDSCTRAPALDWPSLTGCACFRFQRALAEASDINDFLNNADSPRMKIRTASFCTERSGHFDGFDQGLIFFLPNQTWLRKTFPNGPLIYP